MKPSPEREFVTMAVRFFESYGDGAAAIMEKYAGFNDVSSGYWAAKYIEEASARGWIKGYGDGSFRGGRDHPRRGRYHRQPSA